MYVRSYPYTLADGTEHAPNLALIDLALEDTVRRATNGVLRMYGWDNPTDSQRARARGYALAALAGLSEHPQAIVQ